MRPSRRPIIIAARRSTLARTQAQWVGQRLARLHPQVTVEYLWLESEGDERTDVPLAKVGKAGKGLFVRRIEQALLNGNADLAVHSLKDLPTGRGRKGLTLVAIPAREDARDCLITHHANVHAINDLPQNALVGSASPRRAAQLRHTRPDLRVELLRGNVETRLRRVLDERTFDATLLAMAGLVRLGLTQHTALPLDPAVMLPAAGQGALAVQCRGNDSVTLSRCLPLNDPIASEAVHAERAVAAALEGDCDSPIAVHVKPFIDEGLPHYRLRARVLSPDGSRDGSFDGSSPRKQLKQLTRAAVEALKAQGALGMLRGV